MNKPFDARGAIPRADYGTDLHAWALEQAALLRAGRLEEVDAAHVAEELDDVGSEQFDKLESALRVLLTHMLKWDHQPQRRSRSWANSIAVQRLNLRKVLRKNPSLQARIEEALSDAYRAARREASSETDMPSRTFPSSLPYGWDAILGRRFSVGPDDEDDDDAPAA